MSQPAFTKRTVLNYTLLRKLGQGGQGDVFYAENSIGQPAAVKLIHPDYAYNEGLRERFRREAGVMVQLDHPNICKSYGFHQDADQVAIVMEYLEGDDLQGLTDRFGAVQPAKVVDWYRQLLPAFQYAHEQGIIHRDVKPSNVLLTGQNQLKILDFSIAKALLPDGPEARLTGTRTMLGTPLYMSPEQIQSPRSVDARTDIYSLGVMLYTLLAGRAPFDAPDDSLFSLHQQIVSRPVPELPGIPNRLNQIIAKATAKNPAVRHASCSELLQDLEQLYPSPKVLTRTLVAGEQTGATSVSTRLVSALALRIVVVVAPALGAYLMSRNFRLLGDAKQVRPWLIGAIAMLLVTPSLIRLAGVGLLLYGAFIGFTFYSLNKHQREGLNQYGQRGGAYLSGWLLVGICLAYLFLLVVLIGAGL